MTPGQIDRMCSSKAGFSRRTAERKAFWRGMLCYRCPICRRWHLTTRNAPLYR